MPNRQFHVYILASKTRVLYIGVTNNLLRRIFEHKTGAVPGFTSRYHVTRLVYFEDAPDALSAIAREKQLKGWLRARKIALIEAANSTWSDLSANWYGDEKKTDPSLRSG